MSYSGLEGHPTAPVLQQFRDSEHTRRVPGGVTDPDARYHLRMALQYAGAAETDGRSSS